MPPEPPSHLSPELVLVMPADVAAIARLALPAPGFASPTVARPAARRALSPRRVAGLAAVYATAAAVTVTPLVLAFRAVPSH